MSWPCVVRAEEGAGAGAGPNAAAEALFQEGRKLLIEGKAAEACPKLEESQRIDPATGTLMALALCREQQGKLASAWAAFVETEGRARIERRADRESLAHGHATALRPRLSTLTLRIAPSLAATPGLALSLDGVLLGRGAWNVEIPIDGGSHQVEAQLRGQSTWRTTIAIKPEREHAQVDVPPLAASETRVTSAPPPPAASADARKDGATGVDSAPLSSTSPSSTSSSWSPQRSIALVVAATGVVALGVGVTLALDASQDYDRLIGGCPGRVCQDEGTYAQLNDARGRGNMATVVSILGGAALVSGAALWFFAPTDASGKATEKKVASRWWLAPAALPAPGAAISGRF